MSEKASKESQYSFTPPSFASVGVGGVTVMVEWAKSRAKFMEKTRVNL